MSFRSAIHKRLRLRHMLGALSGILLLGAVFLWSTTEVPTPERLRARAALGDTRILDRNGRLIASLPDPLGVSRQPIALDQIAPFLRQATIAVEDVDFYTNAGVDPRGIARAIRQNLQSGGIVAGGSTITQQLARNFLLDPALGQQRSIERKLREAILAIKLTSVYSKDEILALYLNQTFYGGASYGVEAASWRFFGKPARELDLAESALLAGLPQAPSRLDPLADGGAAARTRQAEVLETMVRAGFITPADAQAAAAEPLRFASEPCRPGLCTRNAPHFVAFVLDGLATQLGPETLARGGLAITTTLDLGLQDAAQAILARQIELLGQPRNGGPDHKARNGAVITLDPADGAILAMVGSPRFDDAQHQGQVNATIALRQPGSALKPLTYAAALERGWTPASILLDVPTSFPTREGLPYRPQNYDRAFHGPLLLREALATSSNVAAVQLLHEIGIPALLDMAERLGIRSLGHNPGRFGLALTLGGGEVTLLELTSAYAGFANHGNLVTPYAVIAVSDAEGQLLWGNGSEGLSENQEPRAKNQEPILEQKNKRTKEQKQQPASIGVKWPPCHLVTLSPCQERSSIVYGPPSEPALSPQIAYLISDILSDRYARLRAFGDALEIGRPAAVKTGTTTDWRDNWTVGYTPDRVVGVWVGNADGSPMEAVTGVTGAGPIWRAVMREAHRGLPVHQFQRPEGIVEIPVCADSGLLPSSQCPALRTEIFLKDVVPVQPDNTHVAVRIDPKQNCRVPQGYPVEQTVTRLFRILPPAAGPWAIEAGIPMPPRALCRPPTTDHQPPTTDHRPPGTISDRPVIVAPAQGAIFAISAGVPRERQQIAIQASSGTDAQELTILIDGKPLATLPGPSYRTFWTLEPGRHTITITARDAQGRVTRGAPVDITVEP